MTEHPMNVEFSGAEGNILQATAYLAAEGDHPPAVFMHGGGQTRWSWAGAAAQIAKLGVTSIAVDARGHGESEWVKSQDYALDAYADDLVAITEQVKERFGSAPILIGASLGGLSAMVAIGQQGPDLFSAVVLVDITPTMAPSGVDRIQGFMATNMRQGFTSVEEAADAIAAYLPNRPRPKSLDGLAKNLRLQEDGRYYWHWDPAFIDGPRPINTGRETRGDELLKHCRGFTAPTLLIRGGKSELVTEEAVHEFQQLVPHARFVDVSGAGHMVAGDKNDVFAEAVLNFLKEDVLKS